VTGSPAPEPLDAQETLDFRDAPRILAHADFQLYCDDVPGALALLDQAHAATLDRRYATRAAEVRSWLQHLAKPTEYTSVYAQFYATRRGRFSLKRFSFKRLERDLRILLGRKTRRTVERMDRDPEFRLLEEEVARSRPARVLDAGCGEGRVAIALGARHPDVQIVGLDVARTNVRLARRVNRYSNVTFQESFVEDFAQRTAPGSFDLVYSFAVLEHVADLDATVASILRLLRPGGRFCFSVPMNGLKAVGPLPAFKPRDGVLGHVRRFTEQSLHAQFGRYPALRLVKLPGEWRPEQYPDAIVPVEFGAFFAAFSKPAGPSIRR
jgi:SAM-dependent methyltransferase